MLFNQFVPRNVTSTGQHWRLLSYSGSKCRCKLIGTAGNRQLTISTFGRINALDVCMSTKPCIVSDVFCFAQSQHASRQQSLLEYLQQLSLKLGLQVDEYVAAADQIQTKERWIAGEVVTGEHNTIAQILGDFVVTALAREVLLSY